METRNNEEDIPFVREGVIETEVLETVDNAHPPEQLETEHFESLVHEDSIEYEEEELGYFREERSGLRNELSRYVQEKDKLSTLREKVPKWSESSPNNECNLKNILAENFKSLLNGNGINTRLRKAGNSLMEERENSNLMETSSQIESLDMTVEEHEMSSKIFLAPKPQPLINISTGSSDIRPEGPLTVNKKTYSNACGPKTYSRCAVAKPQPMTETAPDVPVLFTVNTTSNQVLILSDTLEETESSESIAKKRKLETDGLMEKLEATAIAEKKKMKAVTAAEKRKSMALTEKRKLDEAAAAEKRKYNAIAAESRKHEAEAFRLELIRKKNEAEINYLQKKLNVFQNELSVLKKTRALESKELGLLREKVRGLTMSLDVIKNKNDDILFYTGMRNYESFVKLYEFLNPGENGERLMVFYNAAAKNKKIRTEEFPLILDNAAKNAPAPSGPFGNKSGRPKKMPLMDQLLMVMMRLKLGLFPQDLSIRFGVSSFTINRMCICWINFMFHRFSTDILDKMWMTREQIDKEMPKDIQNKYAKTRLIISKAEIKCEVVENEKLHFNNVTLKSYRGLLGISPTGKVTFVSPLFDAAVNDQELVERSGLLLRDFSYGDVILTTERLYIDHLISQIGKNVAAFVPSFLKSASEEIHKVENGKARNEQAVRLGFRVRRRTQKLKNFHLFDRPICTFLAPYVNQLWTVCVILSNYQNPPPKLSEEAPDSNDFDELE